MQNALNERIGVRTVDVLNMVLVAVLVFLVMRQVMPIASGLAGGVGLASFGTLSRTLHAGARPLQAFVKERIARHRERPL